MTSCLTNKLLSNVQFKKIIKETLQFILNLNESEVTNKFEIILTLILNGTFDLNITVLCISTHNSTYTQLSIKKNNNDEDRLKKELK